MLSVSDYRTTICQTVQNMTQCHTISFYLAVKSATKAEYDKIETSKTLWHALCLIFSRSGCEAAANKHD